LTEDEIKLLQKYFCSAFNTEEIIHKEMINEDDFMRLVNIYYQILKENSLEGESILEISPYFLKKIFASYVTPGKNGLIFR
jgi:hypothetical protein